MSKFRIHRYLAATAVLLGVVAPSADAATSLGETFTPDYTCGQNIFLQTASPQNGYVVPAAGVITSWSHEAAPSQYVQEGKLAVGRAASGAELEIVGLSREESIQPGQLNAFPTRIPVSAGDVIGLRNNSSGARCIDLPAAGYTLAYGDADLAVGTTAPFTPDPNIKLDVAAVLEPDADGDGYGDETQDLCPKDGTTQGACAVDAPPQTRMLKGPRAKVRTRKAKKTVSFAFDADDPQAEFTCRLDGGAERACSSPFLVKVGSGRHTFAVTAVDQAGNRDATPATSTFKVKRKKRR
jgi:hypothetical protein